MNIRIVFLLCCCIVYRGSAQTLEQTLFIDFGPSDGTNGNTTGTVAGNFWNNLTSTNTGSTTTNLQNSANEATGFFVDIAKNFSKNGINHGGLLAPDPTLLGEFAVATATQDYFFTQNTSRLITGGLDTQRAYRFTVFASRDNEQWRSTRYRIAGANADSPVLQSSGLGLGSGSSSPNGNDSSVLTSDFVYPGELTGEISFQISVVL